ncbi:hypothetical protein [Saliphagus infecundisoli]|uniref:Uncharacterized protein n=1 Tax=Saliphagus infecundisoli TaxID=1849069 RepID=A0ABD5QK01_9EURY|nr:hypothetical protein [Saliphagus infecundisoli]
MRYLNGPYPSDIEYRESETLAEYSEEGIEVFREQFGVKTAEYTLLTALLIGGYLALAPKTLNPQIIGIAVNVLGALVLARGLFMGPVAIAETTLGGYGGYNSDLRDLMIQDAIDGFWGAILILSGFLIQAVVMLPPFIKSSGIPIV